MGLFSREPPLTPEERARQQEYTHAERMKLIELGRPLPEVELAQAKAAQLQATMDTIRSNVQAIFGAIGPVLVVGVATGATAAVLQLASPDLHLGLVIVIWVCAMLIVLGCIAAVWARSMRLDVARLLRDYLDRRGALKTDAPPVAPQGDGALNPADLTPEEVQRLSRAIQP